MYLGEHGWDGPVIEATSGKTRDVPIAALVSLICAIRFAAPAGVEREACAASTVLRSAAGMVTCPSRILFNSPWHTNMAVYAC